MSMAKRLARTLNFEHDKKGRSWRKIAQDYPGVNFATLNRLAKSKGEWIPAGSKVQELLGLVPQPRAKRIIPQLGSAGWESVFLRKIKPNK